MAGAYQTVTVNLEGVPGALGVFNIDPAALDYGRVLRVVSVYLGAQAKRCFVASATPDGRPWPPFAHPPSARRGGRAAKLLVDRGLLMASMSATAARGAVRAFTRNTLAHGTNLYYASFQNDGTGTIPPRAFLGVTDAMAGRIADLVADDVVRQLGFG